MKRKASVLNIFRTWDKELFPLSEEGIGHQKHAQDQTTSDVMASLNDDEEEPEADEGGEWAVAQGENYHERMHIMVL